jgi:hypothetical protein
MVSEVLVGTTQYIGVSIEMKISALIQLNGAPKEEVGSNTENKLVIIIFILNF